MYGTHLNLITHIYIVMSTKYKNNLVKILSVIGHNNVRSNCLLFQDLEDLYAQFKAHNESKNIFKAARTPAVFFAIAVSCYVLSGVFGLFGMYTMANLCNMVMGISLLTLILWSYVR